MSMTCHLCTDIDCEHAGTDHPQCDDFSTLSIEPDAIIEIIDDPVEALRARVDILETALGVVGDMQTRLARIEREYNGLVAHFVRRASGQ
jgi:hypothetical protein